MRKGDMQLQKNYKKNLGVFFSNNTSLDDWSRKGFINREISYYKKLAYKKKLNIHFFTYGDKKDLRFSNKAYPIKIIPFYNKIYCPNFTILRSFLNLFLPFFLNEEIKKIDLIKSNQVWGALVPCLIKFFYNIPFYIRSGWEPTYKPISFDIPRYKSIFLYVNSLVCYNYADYITVSSKKIHRHICNKFGIKKKIRIIENFIDLNIFKPKKTKKIKNQILTVSRASPQKNIELLIKALSNTNIFILHIGSIKEKIKKKFSLLARKQRTNIKFLGHIDNDRLPNYYRASEAFVLCSKIEGNPKSLLEAMACKCPVIGTNVDGINDIIIDGKNGILSTLDAKNLKQSVLKILENDKLKIKISSAAMKLVKKKNSEQNFLNIESKVIKEISKI